MGADLVGWIVKGPKQLRVLKKHQQQIVRQLLQIVTWWRSLGDDAELEYAPRVNECPVKFSPALLADEDEFLRLMGWLTDAAPENAADHSQRQGIASALERLLDWPPSCRTTHWVEDPDDASQIIVFAGEMTWGDTPETPGYKQLCFLALTGVGALVGIKLMEPCVALNLTD